MPVQTGEAQSALHFRGVEAPAGSEAQLHGGVARQRALPSRARPVSGAGPRTSFQSLVRWACLGVTTASLLLATSFLPAEAAAASEHAVGAGIAPAATSAEGAFIHPGFVLRIGSTGLTVGPLVLRYAANEATDRAATGQPEASEGLALPIPAEPAPATGNAQLQASPASATTGAAAAESAPAEGTGAGVAPAARAMPSSRGDSRPTPDISTPKKFIEAVVSVARDSQRETRVPASVTIAQAILESNWGKSGLSIKGQNYFGIKAASGPGPAGTIRMDTWEVFGGVDTVVKDAFKAYHDLYESVMDHGSFLARNPRYSRAFQTTDPKEFAKRIHEAGYATDPAYCTKLGNLIDRYRLDQYDLKN